LIEGTPNGCSRSLSSSIDSNVAPRMRLIASTP
jgi:hypothetical protein